MLLRQKTQTLAKCSVETFLRHSFYCSRAFIEFLINNIFLTVYLSKLQVGFVLWQESKVRFVNSRINGVLMHEIFHSEKTGSSSVFLYDHLRHGEDWEKWENLRRFVCERAHGRGKYINLQLWKQDSVVLCHRVYYIDKIRLFSTHVFTGRAVFLETQPDFFFPCLIFLISLFSSWFTMSSLVVLLKR